MTERPIEMDPLAEHNAVPVTFTVTKNRMQERYKLFDIYSDELLHDTGWQPYGTGLMPQVGTYTLRYTVRTPNED